MRTVGTARAAVAAVRRRTLPRGQRLDAACAVADAHAASSASPDRPAEPDAGARRSRRGNAIGSGWPPLGAIRSCSRPIRSCDSSVARPSSTSPHLCSAVLGRTDRARPGRDVLQRVGCHRRELVRTVAGRRAVRRRRALIVHVTTVERAAAAPHRSALPTVGLSRRRHDAAGRQQRLRGRVGAGVAGRRRPAVRRGAPPDARVRGAGREPDRQRSSKPASISASRSSSRSPPPPPSAPPKGRPSPARSPPSAPRCARRWPPSRSPRRACGPAG